MIWSAILAVAQKKGKDNLIVQRLKMIAIGCPYISYQFRVAGVNSIREAVMVSQKTKGGVHNKISSNSWRDQRSTNGIH